jgi:hypothetical protein
VIATSVLCISSVIGLIVILKAIPGSSASAIEYGVVTVTSDPPGATIIIDGDAELTGKTDKPLQLPVPKDGDHVVEAKLAGHKDALQSFKFTDGLVVDVKVTLKPE